MKLLLFCDGASRGNPGPAACSARPPSRTRAVTAGRALVPYAG
jgi:ribonuclease HI